MKILIKITTIETEEGDYDCDNVVCVSKNLEKLKRKAEEIASGKLNWTLYKDGVIVGVNKINNKYFEFEIRNIEEI